MKLTPPDIQKYLELLAEPPCRFAAATEGMDDSRLGRKPDPGTWSALEILAHLRSCADVWGASIESMLAGQEPVLPDIHPREWIKRTNYLTIRQSESLQAFSFQRGRMLEILNHLEFEDWSHGAQIGGRRQTVFTQARRLARHERNIVYRWRNS
jgi:DinB superfamily